MDVDALLRELLAGHEPTLGELREIVKHIGSAEFLSESSLERHVRQRIADRQWREGVSAGEYLEDLRTAADAAQTLVVYVRRGGRIACLLAATEVLDPGRTGSRPLANTVVVYSIDRGKVISGYQFSELSELSIPEDARWLQLTASP